MLRMLKNRGASPYHICYEVESVDVVYSELSSKEGWMNVFEPVEAVALNNKKITYFYNARLGLVEFVNK